MTAQWLLHVTCHAGDHISLAADSMYDSVARFDKVAQDMIS